MPDNNNLALMIPILIGALAVMAFVLSIAAVQAKRRGYSFIVWLLAGLFVLNPIYLLVVLATVPHRKRQALRLQFATELDGKLARARPGVAPTFQPVPENSIGDLATLDPRTTAGHGSRSLGDEETRG